VVLICVLSRAIETILANHVIASSTLLAKQRTTLPSNFAVLVSNFLSWVAGILRIRHLKYF